MSIKTKATPSGMAEKEERPNHNTETRKFQPLKGIAAYETLRREWIAANPEHNELELLQVCIQFARVCGLVLRERVLEMQLAKLQGCADGA